MDCGSAQRVTEHKRKAKGKKSNVCKNNSLKVVYISSPMKVKTSASSFRSLVQELTGIHSDVSRYMEANGITTVTAAAATEDFHEVVYDDHRVQPKSTMDDEQASLMSSIDTCRESSTSSDQSFLEPIDNVFSSQMDEQFAGIFSSSLFLPV